MDNPLIGYVPLLVAIVVAVGLGLAILVLNALLGPKRPNAVKGEPFECGNPVKGAIRDRFNVKYYIMALVFLVFDVEIVFLLPWAVEFRRLSAEPGYGVMTLVVGTVFVAVLALGLLYIWRRKALDWGPTPFHSTSNNPGQE
jgi:NADH-quinone oxidoreductase subunit A